MLIEWNSLSEELQLWLARKALSDAAEICASQAEILAVEMECGGIVDQGGPKALRFLAAIVRAVGDDKYGPCGNA